eukprot:s3857_g3.t2
MAGSLLVFDELLNFPYFEREELRAFYEFLRQHRWKYRIVHAPWPAARDRGRCIGWALPDDELTAEASDAVLLGFAPPEARGYGVDAATTAAPKVGPEPKAEALKFNSSMASSALAPNALCGADYRRGDPRRQFLKAILTDLESLDGTEIRGRISFRAPQWLPDPTGIGHGRWLVPRDNPQSPGRVSLALVDPETNEAEIVCETLPPEAHFTATPSWVAWLEAQMSRDSDGECWYISDLVMTSSNITPSSSHDAHRDGPVTSSGTVKRFLSYRMTGDYTYAYGLQGTSWQEHLNCQDAGDELGEALSLLSLAHAYMELSKPKEVLSSADAARKLFRSLGDKCYVRRHVVSAVAEGGCECSEGLSFYQKTVSQEVLDSLCMIEYLRSINDVPVHVIGISTGAIIATLLFGCAMACGFMLDVCARLLRLREKELPKVTLTAIAGLVDLEKGLHYDFDEEQLASFDAQGFCFKEFWLPPGSTSNPPDAVIPEVPAVEENWIKCAIPLSAAYREDFLTLNLSRSAKTTGAPLLILHGDRDRSVPLETLAGWGHWNGEELFRTASEPKEMVLIKGADVDSGGEMCETTDTEVCAEFDGRMGELSALQITADVHARAMRYSEMAQALEKALSLAEVLGDNVTEASLQISFAQAQMGLLEVSSAAPGTDTFRDLGNSSAKAAKKAVALARRQQRSDLVISALCAYSQTQFLVGEKQAARSAAKAAVSLAKGQPLSQANALVLTANSCITLGKMQAAKEAAGNALYLFEEVKDYVGQDLAKATLDAIDNPVSAVSTTGKMRLVRKKKSSVNADALRQKVRNVVSEIVGMDALQDDTPLMQSGLTSQSAVLLRNALSTEIPGSSLPFTLMFDYPSISDLSAFFVESAGGEEEEVEEWVEDPSAGRQVAQARSGPSPDELRKQVRDVVAEIVGMDDLVDDTPLMQAGLTSQSAVLLRNSLSKELPGAS